jgi:hypothetical protein
MKAYPSIPHSGAIDKKELCHVFVKYDGSNLRFEWSKKQGWYKFGTRKTMFDSSHPMYGVAIELFRQRYADGLEHVFKTSKKFKNATNVIAFAEWFGSESFAGQHLPNDPKNIILFDINIHKKGLMSPREFLDDFGHLEVAELLDKRVIDDEFIAQVRNGEFDCSSKFPIANKVPEGVVCKGSDGHDLWMCKIKTQNYHDELKKVLGENWTKYWE